MQNLLDFFGVFFNFNKPTDVFFLHTWPLKPVCHCLWIPPLMLPQRPPTFFPQLKGTLFPHSFPYRLSDVVEICCYTDIINLFDLNSQQLGAECVKGIRLVVRGL